MRTTTTYLKLVVEVIKPWYFRLETLTSSDFSNELSSLSSGFEDVSGHSLPVIEDHLGESLSTGSSTEFSSETERFVDGKVSLDSVHRSSRSLLLREDHTTLLVEGRVDTSEGVLGALNFDLVDGLLESGLGEKRSGVDDTSAGRDELSSSSVNGISVESDIEDVVSVASHDLLSARSLLGSPLESGNARILDFVKELNSLGGVDKEVRSGTIGTEAPDLSSIGNVPSELVGEETSTELEIVTGTDLALLDSLGDLLIDRLSSNPETVVLVLRFGESGHGGFGGNGFTVSDDGRRDLEGDTSVILDEILQANFEMKFSGTSNDVLSGLGDPGLNTRVGLGETLETFDKFGEIVGVLDLDSDLNDRGDREFHDTHVVGSVGGGESSRLEEELINTNETDDVTGRAVLEGLDLSSHHENGTLDRLDEEIVLLSGNVVGTLDADLGSRLDSSREDTTESVETTLVGGGNHLRDVKHEGSLGVAVTDTDGALVVHRSFVQGLDTVSLSGDGGRKVDDNHLQEGVSSGKELPHHDLEELLALEILLVGGESDLELLEKGGDLILLEVHDGVEDTEDGVENEHVETTLESITLSGSSLGRPLLGLGVEVVVTPKLSHKLVGLDTEFLSVSVGELTKGESPSVKSGTESDGTLLGVNLNVSESVLVVHGDDNVDGFDGTGEGLVEVLL